MVEYAANRCNTRMRHKHKRSADRRKHDSSSVAQRISLQTTGYAGRTCDNKPGKKCGTEKKSAGGEGGKEVESKKIKNRTGRICELFLDLGGKWR